MYYTLEVRIMIKTVTRVGNSKGIILDSALLELAHWKEGDQLAVTVHEGGAITFSPVEGRLISEEDATASAKAILQNNQELFDRLSK